MRVLLAYNHILFIQGLRSLLKKDPVYEIVGTAKDGFEVVELTERLGPELIIMDFSLPRQNGLITTKIVKKHHPFMKIILLSMYEEDSYVLQALKAGISGYVLKDRAYQEMREALQTLTRGEIYLSPRVSKELKRCSD